MSTATIPDAFRSLLGDDVKAFADLATLLPDGSAQVTPGVERVTKQGADARIDRLAKK